MKILFESEKADLRYNEETNTIELIWKKYQDEETYKDVFTKGLGFLKECNATGWLSDIRQEGVVNPTNSDWLKTEIIPEAVRSGLKKIAVIMEKDVFKSFYVKGISKSLEKNIIQYFDDPTEANEWLKN